MNNLNYNFGLVSGTVRTIAHELQKNKKLTKEMLFSLDDVLDGLNVSYADNRETLDKLTVKLYKLVKKDMERAIVSLCEHDFLTSLQILESIDLNIFDFCS